MNAASRIIPFGVYMAFVALAEICKPIFPTLDIQALFDTLYPVKTGAALMALIFLRKYYDDINWSELKQWNQTLISLLIGVGVYVAWVNMTWPFAVTGELSDYKPAHQYGPTFQIAIRFAGAAVVVPIMEELFWRSFLARYLLNRNFAAVNPGSFTLFTFIATALLFGLEHQLWLAGILAGLAYNYIYLRSGSVVQCILCHSITNTALGIHVLTTREWYFW